MKIPYIKIYTADLLAKTRKLSPEEIGEAVVAACEIAFEGSTAYKPCSSNAQAFFSMLNGWIMESKTALKSSKEKAKNAAMARWKKDYISDGAKAYTQAMHEHSTKQCHTETDTDTETDTEYNKLLTAQLCCAGPEPQKTEPEKIKTGPVKKSETPLFGGDKFLKKKRELNQLQQFSNEVLAQYEEPMNSKQKGIWFKRNCRCLTDILNFCGNDIPLALATIGECVERLEKAGYTGGYEAVCRNLPEYYAAAKKKLEINNAKNATNTNTVRAF